MRFAEHIYRQLRFSGKTFGPGDRHGGVTDHIRKELLELGAPPDDLELLIQNEMAQGHQFSKDVYRLIRERAAVRGQLEERGDPKEWVDVALLSLDGLWRSLRARYTELTDMEIAELAFEMIESKQTRNEARDWPDWRTMSPDKAIGHVKGVQE